MEWKLVLPGAILKPFVKLLIFDGFVHGPNYHPPYSAIVIDNNSSQVLHDENADEPRHPASLTKIMTLYLLFEQLEAGRLKLDTQLRVSALAALQPRNETRPQGQSDARG